LKVIDEKHLWVRYKDMGDAQAREELVLRYMKIVKYVAGRMAIHVPSSVELDDLISWGVLGLLDAIEKFDHTQGIKFSTYATIRVRGAILDQIRALDWAPRSLRAMARKVGAARDKLRHQQGGEPSNEDIADEMGSTEEQVDDTMAQLQVAHVLSLDDYIPSDEDSGMRKVDLLSSDAEPSPEDAMYQQERRDRIVDAIVHLPEQQQKVLHLYYYEELTLKEVGAVLEVSESRVCQIHGAAMKSLRKVVRGVVK
jgi:RNA polymerase sigma factor for flagellar operon FliA